MQSQKSFLSNEDVFHPRLKSGISSLLLGMVLIGLAYSLMLAFSEIFSNIQQVISLFLALLTTIIISISYILSRRGHTILAGNIAAVPIQVESPSAVPA